MLLKLCFHFEACKRYFFLSYVFLGAPRGRKIK